jgi:hypothetical protein
MKARKELCSKSQKLKFVMIIVSRCQCYLLVASCSAVKCRKQSQVMSASCFGLRSSDYNKKNGLYLKTDSARILNNIFRVRLGKVLKNINLL